MFPGVGKNRRFLFEGWKISVSRHEPLPAGRYFAEAKLSIASLCGENSGRVFPRVGTFRGCFSKGWKTYRAPGRGARRAGRNSGQLFRRRRLGMGIRNQRTEVGSQRGGQITGTGRKRFAAEERLLVGSGRGEPRENYRPGSDALRALPDPKAWVPR